MAGDDDRTINDIITSANSSQAGALPLLQFEKHRLAGKRWRKEDGSRVAKYNPALDVSMEIGSLVANTMERDTAVSLLMRMG